MRGSMSDFFAAAPARRVAFPSWPPDFNPADVEKYAALPPAPEVQECQACRFIGLCRPGHFARAECREQDLGFTPPQARAAVRDGGATQAAVLRCLREGPASIADIERRSGLTYSQVRRGLDSLTKSRPAQARQLPRTYANEPKRYALATSEDAPLVETFAALRPLAERVLAELKARGELTVTQLAAALDLEPTAVRYGLAHLDRAGLLDKRTVAGGPSSGDRKLYRVRGE